MFCLIWPREYNHDIDDRCKGIPYPINSETLRTVERINSTTKKYRSFQDADDLPDIMDPERQEAKPQHWQNQKEFW